MEAPHPLSSWEPLNGKTAVVTGGSGELGSAVCRALAAHGADVGVNYLRNDDAAAAVCDGISGLGRVGIPLQANVDRPSELTSLFESTEEQLGPVDVIVHCASLGTFSPLLETRRSHWDLTMGTHARAFWELGKIAKDRLRPGGTLIGVSSLGGRSFTPSYGAVGPSKGALETLVTYLAAELAPRGLRVNAVCGGPLDGNRLRGSPVFSQIESASRAKPCGRLGEPKEVADVVVFLASPLARWVQGQVLVVDGGFSL